MNFIKMNQTNGYIYVRNHPSYDVDDTIDDNELMKYFDENDINIYNNIIV